MCILTVEDNSVKNPWKHSSK